MPIAANLYYSLSEKGSSSQPALVLIHGAASTHQSWPAELRRLGGWNVLALDLPGHGRSEGVGQRSITRYSAAVADFLAELQIYQAILVGHCMGGAIALQVALEQPALVAGLGLVGSGAYLGVPASLLELLTSPLTQSQSINLLQELIFSPLTPPAVVEQCLAPLRELRHSVLAGDWQACSTFDLREQVDRITCPAWMAVGADDRLTPPAYARYLAAHLANSHLEIIPAAGHMLPAEQPGELTTRLREFLISLFNYQFNW